MSISLKGFDIENNEIELPKVLWYEHYIGKFGFEETFKIGFSKRIPFKLAKVIVTKENKKECECFVDYIELEANKFGVFHTVKLKSNICRLFENEVLPTSYEEITLKQILKNYAKDFNITFQNPSFKDASISNFYVETGMSAFDVLQLFFQTFFRKYVFLNEEKQLTFPYFPSNQINFGRLNKFEKDATIGFNYNKIKIIDNRSKLISDAYAKIIYDDEKNFLHLDTENEFAKRCNIKRVKYCNVPKHWQVLLNKGSDFMVRKQNEKRFYYELTTREEINLFPGIIFKIKEMKNNDTFFILNVLTSFKDCGRKTKISFINYRA